MKERGIKITNIEKEAKEIVERFRKLAKISGGTGNSEPAAKQCAIIALEMIIESNPTTVYDEKDFCNKMHYLNLIDVIREL